MMMLQRRLPGLAIEQVDDVTLVKLTAAAILDESAAHAIGQRLLQLTEQTERPRLVLDFGNVRQLTSTVFGKLILLRHKVRAAQGRLVLFGIRPEVYVLFEILRLHRLFDICDDEREALCHLALS